LPITRPLRTLQSALRSAAGRWALRRQGEDALPVRLTARRIYILPTRSGVAFGVMLLGVLFGGLNFGNSLALLLCFTLGALSLVAMFQCHRRLLDVEVVALDPQRTFAGEPIPVHVRLRPGTRDARDFRLRLDDGAPSPNAWVSPGEASVAGEATATLQAAPAARGPWTVPRIRIEQRAPFGLFQAWTWIHPRAALHGLVWPRAHGVLPLPETGGERHGDQLLRAGRDEWSGLRPFREGDSPRQVAWKAYARGAPLLVREYQDPHGNERRLDHALLPALDTESRLSQLARWVVEADGRGERWSLHGPDFDLPLDAGAAHRVASLDALAGSGFR
jgi:uncharacterized protein (DUF58 family)